MPSVGDGWSAVFAYTGFKPIVLIEFEHIGGGRGKWFIDAEDGTWLGDKIEMLTPAACQVIRLAIARWENKNIDSCESISGFEFVDLETRKRIQSRFNILPGRERYVPSQTVLSFMANRSPLQIAQYLNPDRDRAAFREGWIMKAWGPNNERLSYGASECIVHLVRPPSSNTYEITIDIDHAQSLQLVSLSINKVPIGEFWLDPLWQRKGIRVAYRFPASILGEGDVVIGLHSTPAIADQTPSFSIGGVSLYVGRLSSDEAELTPKQLLSRFQSLGDNCEFGFAQRFYGAEPLGLFRFAGFSGPRFDEVGTPRQIIEILEQRLDGIGARGTFDLDIRSGEYTVHDLNYGLRYHTFRYVDSSDRGRVIEENQKVLGYLKRRFLEDLGDGTTIWVYKRALTRNIGEILALHSALSRYGRNRLFWVTEPTNGESPCEVRWVGEDLLMGFSDQLVGTDGTHFEPTSWLSLCKKAYAEFRQADY